jgi:uncharacterized RDD family membrane protein YckC
MLLSLALNLGETHSATFVRADGTTASQSGYTVAANVTNSLLALLSAGYCIALWRFAGCTVAQRAFGLRVLDSTQPRHLGVARAGARWFLLFGWTATGIASNYYDPTWLFTIAGFAWFMALLVSTWRNDQKRGIHDRFGRSLVVSRARFPLVAYQPPGTTLGLPTAANVDVPIRRAS